MHCWVTKKRATSSSFSSRKQSEETDMAEAKRLTVISWHGTLDAAYPPLILSIAAVAMDMKAEIFFTIFGLGILKKGNADKLEVAPIANPAMLQPVPGFPSPISSACFPA
jgi:hypothetical protein